jgi:hypothetical protein
MAHRSDGPALSPGCLCMGTEQCAVVDVNSKCLRNMFALDMCLHTRQDKWGKHGKCWSCRGGGGGAARHRTIKERGEGVASSSQHHQGDGHASSLGRMSMGKAQRARCSEDSSVVVEAAVWLKLASRTEQLGTAPSRR